MPDHIKLKKPITHVQTGRIVLMFLILFALLFVFFQNILMIRHQYGRLILIQHHR